MTSYRSIVVYSHVLGIGRQERLERVRLVNWSTCETLTGATGATGATGRLEGVGVYNSLVSALLVV